LKLLKFAFELPVQLLDEQLLSFNSFLQTIKRTKLLGNASSF
jgi:hypothetical protein